MILEKSRISSIFKAFSRVVLGKNVKPKNRKNEREWVYTQTALRRDFQLGYKRFIELYMHIKFLGVRGSSAPFSFPCRIYGYHTACIQITTLQNTVVFFDAGTGLSNVITAPSEEIHIVLSHVHLDHIAGLASCPLMWRKEITVHFWGPPDLEKNLKKIFSPPFFPIALRHWNASLHFHDVLAGKVYLIGNDLKLLSLPLHHPGGVLGYRLMSPQGCLAYLTDMEHGHPLFDQSALRLMDKADLALYDAMFDQHTYPHHKGWGHSTWEQGLIFAQEAGVQKLALIHHDPQMSDDQLLKRDLQIKKKCPTAFLARQDMTLHIPNALQNVGF